VVNDLTPAEPVRIDIGSRQAVDAQTYIASVYDECESRVYGLALASTRDPDLAADVTQEAFLKLLREAQAGRYPDSAIAWLHRTTRNLIVDRSRRAAVASRFAPRLLRRDEPDEPHDVAIDHERSAELGRALAQVPLEQRMALIMAAQGASGVEIAERIGRSHAATRVLLYRARQRLRCVIEQMEVAR
jgi:RNA polymerase sigma-70 factor (ECF subfamily)